MWSSIAVGIIALFSMTMAVPYPGTFGRPGFPTLPEGLDSKPPTAEIEDQLTPSEMNSLIHLNLEAPALPSVQYSKFKLAP